MEWYVKNGTGSETFNLYTPNKIFLKNFEQFSLYCLVVNLRFVNTLRVVPTPLCVILFRFL